MTIFWNFEEKNKKKMYLFCIFQTCTSELSSTLHLYYPEWYFWIIQTLTSWLSRPVCLDYPYLLNKKYLVLFSSIGALKGLAKKPVLSKIVATQFSEKLQFCRYYQIFKKELKVTTIVHRYWTPVLVNKLVALKLGILLVIILLFLAPQEL